MLCYIFTPWEPKSVVMMSYDWTYVTVFEVI